MKLNNYQDASEKLGNRQSRKIANNTYLQRRDADTIALLYHATDVITFKSNGDVTLDSGGWRTTTTKERFNYGPMSVYSQKGVWYVNGEYPYEDGITLHANGSIIGYGDDPQAQRKLSYLL